MLRRATGEETEKQAMSRASASNLAVFSPGTGSCCANGACSGGMFTNSVAAKITSTTTTSSASTCLPVGSAIDVALAGVESAVAKATCWTAPISLPTDDGDIDIAPLLGADGRDAAIDAFRDRIECVYRGNEWRLYLSSKYGDSDDATVSALQEVLGSRAKASCVELKIKRRTYSFKERKHPYIECKCKHRSSDGLMEGKSKDYAKEGDMYAANVSQGRKDKQSRSDIKEKGSRGHKSNALNTPKCSMYFSIKYDNDKSQW